MMMGSAENTVTPPTIVQKPIMTNFSSNHVRIMTITISVLIHTDYR